MLKIALALLALPSAMAMVGGEVTPKDSAFAQRSVLLLFGQSNRCSATLLNRRVLLTAAHCLGANARGYTAAFTTDLTLYLEGKEQVPLRKIQQIFIHPGYERGALKNDMALAVLAEPAPENALAAPLPEASQEINDGASLVSLGYGLQNREGIPFPMTPGAPGMPWEAVQLRQKDFSSSPIPEELAKLLGPDPGRNKLHVSQPESGICVGDSGGPVYLKRAGAEPLLVGINGAVMTSQDARCGPSALVNRIDADLEWIRSVMGKFAD